MYSGDDRCRWVDEPPNLFMNRCRGDMTHQRLTDFDLIDMTSFVRDGSTRTVWGYRAISYDIPAGNVCGYMPK